MLKKLGLGPRPRDPERWWKVGWNLYWFRGSADCAVASSAEPLDVGVLLRNTSATGADFPGCEFPK